MPTPREGIARSCAAVADGEHGGVWQRRSKAGVWDGISVNKCPGEIGQVGVDDGGASGA